MYNVFSTISIYTIIGIWMIVSFVIALVGGILVYFLLLKPEKDVQNKFLAWVKEYFTFNKMLIEDILKIAYIVLAIFITLFSFSLIAINFFEFLFLLVFGNIILRLLAEFLLLFVMLWKNTNDINKRLKSSKKD